MASLNGPAFQGSNHSHGHQRSHRKVPNRLPLDGSISNYGNPDGNGFLDHPGDDNSYEPNGFMTPATSRFPSEDMSGFLSHNNYDPNQTAYSHSRSNSDIHGHAHTIAYEHTPVLTAQPMFETTYIHSKITSAIISVLIALPFVLSSLVQVSPFELAEPVKELDGGGIRWKARMQSRYLSFLGVCSLTAATLVTVGFLGELQAAKHKTSSKSTKAVRDQLVSLASLKEVAERILSIGLPLYATSKLGGERVAVVILMASAAELTSKRLHAGQDSMNGVWNMVQSRKWTFGALLLQMVADVLNLTTPSLPMQTLSGYLALSISVLILPWPFPITAISVSNGITDKGSRRNSSATTWEILGASVPRSSLISSSYATDITVASGVLATVISFVVFLLSSQETQNLTIQLLLGGSIVAIASAVSLLFADVRALLPSTTSLSLGFALGASLFIQEVIDSHPLLPIFFQSVLILVSWACVCLDVKWLQTHSHAHDHEQRQSWLTKLILQQVEDVPLLHKIFSKKDSRRIVYFLTMNFSFMFIQGIWGYLTGSLGLLSDTVHMFFDCAALLVGLVATLLSEKPANLEYPYGYAKVDALAGFGNGVLLLAISVELVYEALERIASGSQLNRLGELLVVSTGGLLVNVFGLLAFGHHGHSHGHDHDHGHDHGHNHSNGHVHAHSHDHDHNHKHSKDCQHSHNPSSDHKANHNHSHSTYYDAIPYANGGLLYSPAQGSPSPATTPKTPAIVQHEKSAQKHDHHEHKHSHAPSYSHSHSHSHSHGHSHAGGSNMHGIYLHILADMMGSISVMISTVLVHYTGWAGWDALASVAISYFIIMATIPLVKSTAKELVLDIPEDKEFDLREALSGIGQLRGVVNITAPRFWLESNETSGVMHVVASKGADLDDVRERAVSYLKGKGMDVLVQVEREGEGRCWCGSANATTTTRAS